MKNNFNKTTRYINIIIFVSILTLSLITIAYGSAETNLNDEKSVQYVIETTLNKISPLWLLFIGCIAGISIILLLKISLDSKISFLIVQALIFTGIMVWAATYYSISDISNTIKIKGKASINVLFKSEPSKADILLNNSRIGRTPIVLTLPPDTYDVTFEKIGYIPQKAKVAFNENDKFSIKINSVPDNAQIFLDGKFINNSPFTITDIRPGEHTIELKKEGFKDLQTSVDINDKSKQIDARLDAIATINTPESTKTPSKTASKNPFNDTITAMEFVFVEGGCYNMGCGGWENYCDRDEKPVHKVCVDDYYIAKFEVTQGQWKKVMAGENPSVNSSCGDNCPVENITWNDAHKFISNLNSLNKAGKYRLPTEAEWEYACRSGGKEVKVVGIFDTGGLASYSNFCDSNCDSISRVENQNDGFKTTAPVGSFKANDLGIYDMIGNVWEFTIDSYNKDAYKKHQINNPIFETPLTNDKVRRGGSWYDPPKLESCVYRSSFLSEKKNNAIGFRLLRTP